MAGEKKALAVAETCAIVHKAFFFSPLILLFSDKLLGQLNSSETTAHAGLSTFFKLQIVCFKAVFTEALIKKGINLRLQVSESKI